MTNKEIVTLKKIIYNILTDRDRLDILNHIIARLTEIAGGDSYIDKYNATLITVRDRLHKASTKSHSSIHTETINSLNQSRKDIISNIHSGLTYYKGDSDKERSGAALYIGKIFLETLTHLPDNKKRTLSAAIKTFLKVLSKPESLGTIEKLEFSQRIQDLQETQDGMDQLIELRAQSEELDTTPTLIKARHDMHDMVDVLEGVLYLNVLLNEPGMEELVHKLNGRIGEILSTAKSIHTLGEHQEEREELIDEQEEGEVGDQPEVD